MLENILPKEIIIVHPTIWYAVMLAEPVTVIIFWVFGCWVCGGRGGEGLGTIAKIVKKKTRY